MSVVNLALTNKYKMDVESNLIIFAKLTTVVISALIFIVNTWAYIKSVFFSPLRIESYFVVFLLSSFLIIPASYIKMHFNNDGILFISNKITKTCIKYFFRVIALNCIVTVLISMVLIKLENQNINQFITMVSSLVMAISLLTIYYFLFGRTGVGFFKFRFKNL